MTYEVLMLKKACQWDVCVKLDPCSDVLGEYFFGRGDETLTGSHYMLTRKNGTVEQSTDQRAEGLL
jgi:hypothetical protein